MAPARSLRNDFVAGFLVALIALPLSLGVALASGFPPAAGVLTAVVGGVVVNFLGNAPLTIKGTSASLIIVVLGAATELGYRGALAVGVVAACIQIVLALIRVSAAAAAIPRSVVHGMLAAIGIILIAEQAHSSLGVVPHNQAPLALLFEIPSSLAHADPRIALIGLLALVISFGLPQLRGTRFARIPVPLVVLLVAVALGYGFDLEPEQRLHMPGSLLDAIAFPDFSQITTPTSLQYIAMFALVGSIESTLNVVAVDSLDPRKRASNLDRDLLVVGLGNLVASTLGGLPMISELVRSRANVDAGATSRVSNFFHGLLLLGFVVLLPMLLQHVPLAALAAMVIYAGAQLLAPATLVPVAERGWEQQVLFWATLLVTLATNLLIGVGVGLMLKLVLTLVRGGPPATLLRGDLQVERSEGELRLVFRNAATFSSLWAVQRALESLPEEVRRVTVDVRGAELVDRTLLTRILHMSETWPQAELVFLGIDEL